MSTPEGKVKRKVRTWIHETFPGCWHYCPRGGPFGKAGAPDDLILWNGVFIGMEIKTEGENPTPLQLKALQDIRSAGGIAVVVRGYDIEKLALLKRIVYERYRLINAL